MERRYIALLRGINVGGNNKVPMPRLRELFEELGFTEVSTYINSGNVLFNARKTDEDTLIESIKKAIKEEFALDIPLALISAEELASCMAHAPAWWGQDEESKHNAIFVIAPATGQAVLEEIGAIKPEYEKIGSCGKMLFWSAPIKTFSRTRLSKVVGTSLYSSITVRNANTACKLLQLSGG